MRGKYLKSFCHLASLLRLFCNLRLQMRVCLNKRWGLGKPNSDAESTIRYINVCILPQLSLATKQEFYPVYSLDRFIWREFSLLFSFLYFRYLFSSRTTDFGSPDKKEDFEWLIKWVSRFCLFPFQRLATQLHYRVYTVSCWSTQSTCALVSCVISLIAQLRTDFTGRFWDVAIVGSLK